VIELDANRHGASDGQRLIFVEPRAFAKDFGQHQDDQPVDDREEVDVGPGGESKAVD